MTDDAKPGFDWRAEAHRLVAPPHNLSPFQIGRRLGKPDTTIRYELNYLGFRDRQLSKWGGRLTQHVKDGPRAKISLARVSIQHDC